jgi:phosphatidylglycerophosphate synthase
VFVPFIVISFMTSPVVTAAALLCFMVADLMDGVIARRRGGDGMERRVADTIVDRVAIAACLIGATAAGALPFALLIGFLLRDVYCACLCWHLLRKRGLAIRVDGFYRVPSFVVVAWALAAPFVSVSLRVVAAAVTLAVFTIIAADLSRLVWRLSTASFEAEGPLVDARAVRGADGKRRHSAQVVTALRDGPKERPGAVPASA